MTGFWMALRGVGLAFLAADLVVASLALFYRERLTVWLMVLCALLALTLIAATIWLPPAAPSWVAPVTW